jgi:predicted Zn finger-like uncharacterized protein
MALATQCPHCFTTFRVAADQLKLRGGIVRCGACQSIFDGNAHLIDLDKLAAEKAAGDAAAAAAVPGSAEPALPEPPPAAAGSGTQPVYTLDFTHTFDPLGILPNVAAPEEMAPAVQGAVPRVQVWRTGMPRPANAASAEAEGSVADVPVADAPAAEAPVADTAAVDTPGVDTPAPVALQAATDAATDAPMTTAALPAPSPATPLAPADAYAPPGRIEPSFDVAPDDERVARPLPDVEPEPAPSMRSAFASESATDSAPGSAPESASPPEDKPADIFAAALPLRASAGDHAAAPAPLPGPGAMPALKSARNKAVDARTRRSKLTPTRIEAPKLRVPVDGDADEPEFVKRSRRQERTGKTRRILLGAGIAVLALALAAQLVLAFRNTVAARYPGARPALSGACALLGCRVELPAEVENLAIETGELNPLGADAYVLDTLLRNGGNLLQAWPSIELELIDADDKPVLRRVLGPADYLPPGVHAGAGFGPHSEQPVKLHFALAGLKPSGYHTFVFYP